jgi:hypothetical protein
MELSLSGDSTSRSGAQEFSNAIWKPKVHYRIHKSPRQVPVLGHLNPIIPPHPIFLRSFLVLSPDRQLLFQAVSFHVDFSPKSFTHACYMPSLSHPP